MHQHSDVLLEDLTRDLARMFRLKRLKRDRLPHCKWRRGRYLLVHIDGTHDESERGNKEDPLPAVRGSEWVELVRNPDTDRELSIYFTLDRETDSLSMRYTRSDFPPQFVPLANYYHLEGGVRLRADMISYMIAYLTHPSPLTVRSRSTIPQRSPPQEHVFSLDFRYFRHYKATLLDVIATALL